MISRILGNFHHDVPGNKAETAAYIYNCLRMNEKSPRRLPGAERREECQLQPLPMLGQPPQPSVAGSSFVSTITGKPWHGQSGQPSVPSATHSSAAQVHSSAVQAHSSEVQAHASAVHSPEQSPGSSLPSAASVPANTSVRAIRIKYLKTTPFLCSRSRRCYYFLCIRSQHQVCIPQRIQSVWLVRRSSIFYLCTWHFLSGTFGFLVSGAQNSGKFIGNLLQNLSVHCVVDMVTAPVISYHTAITQYSKML